MNFCKFSKSNGTRAPLVLLLHLLMAKSNLSDRKIGRLRSEVESVELKLAGSCRKWNPQTSILWTISIFERSQVDSNLCLQLRGFHLSCAPELNILALTLWTFEKEPPCKFKSDDHQ